MVEVGRAHESGRSHHLAERVPGPRRARDLSNPLSHNQIGGTVGRGHQQRLHRDRAPLHLGCCTLTVNGGASRGRRQRPLPPSPRPEEDPNASRRQPTFCRRPTTGGWCSGEHPTGVPASVLLPPARRTAASTNARLGAASRRVPPLGWRSRSGRLPRMDHDRVSLHAGVHQRPFDNALELADVLRPRVRAERLLRLAA